MGQKVHLLWFIPEGEEDDGPLIGVYESELAAKAAIERLRSKPGFIDYPQGFQIHSRELGQDDWTEGFVRDH
jgi:homoserine kinase type II